MNNKLQAKDLINLGLFTVLYFVIGCCVAIPIGFVPILKSGDYKSAKKSILGYAVFSLWMVGTYIPMYFMVEDSWASFAASFGEEYADRVMAVMPMWSIILVVAGIFVFAILGGLLGKTLLKKHFAKAGIA